MSVWGKVTGKRKAFLSLLLDGVPPYDACRKVWPHVKDVYGHVTLISADKDFKEVYARLFEFQSSREQLIGQCLRIIESDVDERHKLDAIKTVAALRGHIRAGMTKAAVPRGRTAPIDDDKILEKMAELGQKAYKGEKGKAN